MKKKYFIGLMLIILLVVASGCGGEQAQNDTIAPQTISSLETAELITQEWKDSSHQSFIVATADRGIGCEKCHDGYVFSEQENLANVEYTLDHQTGIDCQACHTGFGKERITTGLASLPFTSEPIEAGSGAVCLSCHNGNRNPNDLFAQSEAGNLERFSYPHYGMAAAVVTAQGGMEFPGVEYPNTLAHSNLEDSCTTCHMPQTDEGYKSHSFNMDLAYIDQTCASCHEGADTFNINGFQDEIKGMLTTLEAAILEASGAATIETGGGVFTYVDSNGEAIQSIPHEVYVATYNWRMVAKDGSYGVHNPEYAKTLLDESYKALTGNSL